MLDRHEVLAEEEFFPLAAARAMRHELAAFRSKLRALGYSEDAITRTLAIEGPYALTRLGRELWPRYVIPGNEPLSVLIRLFLLCLSEPEPLVREVLGGDDLELLRDLRLLSVDGPGRIRSPIGLYPVGPLVVATDWWRRFNALLNEMDNCSFEQGDLYGPVGDLRFDAITGNAPFVPVPGSTELLYRDGGPSGEDVLRQIVAGCSEHLKERGVCLVVTDLVEHRGTNYEEKLTRWLGTDSGFTAAVLKRPAETIYQYASTHLSHTDPFGISPAMFEWIDHYLAERIEEVAHGYIAIRRSDQPGTRIMTVPIARAIGRDLGTGLVEELLQRVETASSTPVSELRFSPRFHPGNVQLLPEGADLTDVNLPYLVVSGLQAAARSDGTISLGALLSAFREAGHEVGPRRREDLEHILRQLYVSWYLDPAVESGEAPAAPVGEHEAAMKMWWSR